MKTILAFPGSNSRKSINKALVSYVARRVEDADVTMVDLNEFDLPVYGIDREIEQGIPDDAGKLYNLIGSVDGLILSLAEHNGSYTTAFKNALDWLSRVEKALWQNKPMLLMATSPGGNGAQLVLSAAKQYFPRLGGNIVADFSLPLFGDNFSDNGLSDTALQADLDSKIKLWRAAL